MRIKNCIYSAFTLENPLEISKSCHWRCRSRSFWGCDWHWPEPEPGLVPVYHRWPGGWSHSLTEICNTRFFLLRSKFMIWTYSPVSFQVSIWLSLFAQLLEQQSCYVLRMASYPGPACYQSGAVQEELGGKSASRLRRQIARSLTFQIVTISATATVFRSKSFAKYENIRSSLSSARPVLMFGF